VSCHGEGNNRTHLYGHNDEHVTWTLAINCILSHTSSFRNRPLSRLLDVAPGCSCLLLWVECVQMVPLAGVSAAHRFQVSRACLSMFTRSRSSLPISDYFQQVAYSNRRRLRSSSSSLLLIRRTRLVTVGDRAFPVAGREAASGTVSHTSLRQLRLSLFSESGSKLIFSLVRSRCNWRTMYWHTA